MLPRGPNSFLLQKALGVQESKHEVTKVVLLVKNDRKSTKIYPGSLNILVSQHHNSHLSFKSRPLFWKGLRVQESKQEVTKVVSLVKNGRIYKMAESTKCIQSP